MMIDFGPHVCASLQEFYGDYVLQYELNEDGVRHEKSAIQELIERHYATGQMVSPVFEYAKISVLAYANGFTLWHYKCDAVANITEFFFEAAADLLTVGDLIICSGVNGARIVSVAAAGPPRIVSTV